MKPGMIEARHRRWAAGRMKLEGGEAIEDFELSYVTHGKLSEAGDNAVLVAASLAGNHHRLDFLIGEGKALDPQRYFVVCADPIGNGLSSSPSNSEKQPGMRFPRFSIRDMVQSQYRLLTEELGVKNVLAVVGASMGGMQALQWGVSHPDFMRAIAAITPMAGDGPEALEVAQTGGSALLPDPARGGERFVDYPERGWAAWSGVMSVLAGRTPRALAEMIERPLDTLKWMDKVTADNRANGFDATDWLYQSWAYQAMTSERPGTSTAISTRHCSRLRRACWCSHRRSTCSIRFRVRRSWPMRFRVPSWLRFHPRRAIKRPLRCRPTMRSS